MHKLVVLSQRNTLHDVDVTTPSPRQNKATSSYDNFGKCSPISTILSILHLRVNCGRGRSTLLEGVPDWPLRERGYFGVEPYIKTCNCEFQPNRQSYLLPGVCKRAKSLFYQIYFGPCYYYYYRYYYYFL